MLDMLLCGKRKKEKNKGNDAGFTIKLDFFDKLDELLVFTRKPIKNKDFKKF